MGRLARGGEESLTELSVAFGTGKVTYEPHTPSPNAHDGVSSVLCHVRPSHGRRPPLLPSVRASQRAKLNTIFIFPETVQMHIMLFQAHM